MPLSGFSDNEDMVHEAVEAAKAAGHLRAGDVAVVLAGIDGRARSTDVLRVVNID